MNRFVPALFDERVDRLALGLEPRDAVSRLRPARPVSIALDGAPRVPLDRHGSGRFVLLFDDRVTTPVDVRLVPRDRRYVPRRMQFAIVSRADVLAAELADDDVPVSSRAWTPLIYPGAAYDVGWATGARGRVTRGGVPVRWTRVAAFRGEEPVGFAHGDDRGEFVLVLGTDPAAVGDLTPAIDVTIDVYARDPALPVSNDALADLPLEVAAAPYDPHDDVTAGVAVPDHYVRIAHLVDRPMTLGRLTSVPIHV